MHATGAVRKNLLVHHLTATLMMRLRRYTTQEKAAAERWSADCRMRPLPGWPDRRKPADDMGLPDPYEEAQGG